MRIQINSRDDQSKDDQRGSSAEPLESETSGLRAATKKRNQDEQLRPQHAKTKRIEEEKALASEFVAAGDPITSREYSDADLPPTPLPTPASETSAAASEPITRPDTPSSSDASYAMSKLDVIAKRTNELKRDADAFVADVTKLQQHPNRSKTGREAPEEAELEEAKKKFLLERDKEFLRTCELLMQELLKLDAIPSIAEEPKVAQRRKKQVQEIQRIIDAMENAKQVLQAQP